MLKIKDDVDLKILIDEYGFKPQYDVDTGELIELYRINGHYIGDKEKTRQTATITLTENWEYEIRNNWFRIFGKEKRITPKSYYLRLDVEDYEILYDLIKADMVEKVEE